MRKAGPTRDHKDWADLAGALLFFVAHYADVNGRWRRPCWLERDDAVIEGQIMRPERLGLAAADCSRSERLAE